jgi:predicted Fe-S protein YdhL (DUF1289 family)
MTLHDEILRLRDLVRRMADEPDIDPMSRWQGLTDDERQDIWLRFMDSPRAARIFKTMHAAEEAIRRKNGF